MRRLRVFIAITVALIAIMIAAHMIEIRKIPKDYEAVVYDNASILCKQATTLYQQGETIVELSKIAAFEWDEVYFFPYYISYTGGSRLTYKEIGYRWGYIKENPIGEGYEHVIFTNQGKVVCYIPGTV